MAGKERIIIIGGNAAGPAAAAKAKRVNPEAEVLLFEAGKFISTGTCELPYVLSGDINCYKDILFFTPEEFKNKKGVDVFINHKALSLNRRAKLVTIQNLENNEIKEISYDKLILTTGSKAIEHPELNYSLDNVFSLKSIKDLIDIKSYINENNVKKVAIFGSGFIGLETVDALSKLNLEVTLFDIEELPYSKGGELLGKTVLELLKKNNIEFYGNKELKYFINDNKLNKIKVEGWLKEFDLVITALGVRPNNDLAIDSGLELNKDGSLKTDKKQKTSDFHIYAAGDNCGIVNYITRRPDYFPNATVARAQGYVAGENSVKGNAYFEPVVKNTAFKFFDYAIVNVGLTKKEADDYGLQFTEYYAEARNLVHVMPGSKKIFGKILVDKYRMNILGASFFGTNEVVGYADIISTFIKNNIKADKLAEVDFNYTPPFSPFVNLLSILGNKIKRG